MAPPRRSSNDQGRPGEAGDPPDGDSAADAGEPTGARQTATSERPDTSAFGTYLRTQRQLARLSLRQLARLTRISDPYLSQIERGLHQPSVAVIRSIAEALQLSAEEVLAHAAGITGTGRPAGDGVEAAIRADERLSTSQKSALITVYRSMVAGA
jgi:transcriptional regulator with XRE-family HTH domain